VEGLIVTPSNHRVHHGSDEKYLDKNFGTIFIVWDRLFGTYQAEEERPTYGITIPIKKSLNPLYLNLHEYGDIVKDVKTAPTLRQKLFYIFGRPAAIARSKKEGEKSV
jgi:hypothetical protein